MKLSRRSILCFSLLLTCGAFATGSAGAAQYRTVRPQAAMGSLRTLYNLDYSNGAISTFTISGTQATLAHQFRLVNPKNGSTNGIAAWGGNIYTAVDAPGGKPCVSCLMVLQPNGTLVEEAQAPTISGAPAGPDITDVSVDKHGNVFASDYGQQATYWYANTDSGLIGPHIIVQGTHDAASVAVAPNAKSVFVSGGCGFASVRPFVAKRAYGKYTPGTCFGIGTIALIGGAADDAGDVATPVDGVFGLVSISNSNGNGYTLMIPDQMGGVGGVTFSRNAGVLYVADSSKQIVYAFARPSGGWVSGQTPALLATYTGFQHLNIIAVDL